MRDADKQRLKGALEEKVAYNDKYDLYIEKKRRKITKNEKKKAHTN